jgi:hypothetical protein
MGDPEESDGDDGDSGGGAGAEGDDAADGAGDTPPESLDGDVEHSWGKAGAGEPGEEEGDGGEPLTDEDAELMKALTRDLEGKMQEEWNRELNPIAVSSSGEWAQRIFGDKKTSTRLMLEEPTIQDRQAVVKVAAALSNLALPAVAKVSKAVVVPPGRMRSREALRASAERAQGQMVSARPWKSTVRRHTNARPLVLGVATDTSGSMRWAEKAVASFAYVYANAGHRIGARTAAVTYGDHVHRIARPGEVMEKIVRKTANDSTEEFDRAMAALDGVLHLTTPSSAAKILLVISDGAYVKGDEADKAAMWLRAMDRAGTHIVWITEHDTRDTSYDYWLDDTARKLPRMTVRAAFPKGKKRTPYGAIGPSNVFDMINGAALEAITKDVSA